MERILLIAQILTAILLTWAIFAAMLAWARLRPPRLTDAKALFFLKRLTPEDLGLAYESVRFGVLEQGEEGKQIALSAWLVRHPQANGRLVVLLHGYSDAKIGAAAWLPLLHDMGVNVLLLDLPAHGDSEGQISTAGWRERHQVAQVVRQFAAHQPDDCRQVVLFGISMGAAIALATASLEPSIRAVIADSPYSSFPKASTLHATVFGLPGALLQHPATWMQEWFLGIRYAEIAPVRMLREVPCPVLLLAAGKDQLVSEEDAEVMKDAVCAKGHQDGASRVVDIENAPHILGLASNPGQYRDAIGSFLETAWKKD